ncbi:hypothetical protein BKA93DRAFT_479216 [Sparassis latifolia]
MVCRVKALTSSILSSRPANEVDTNRFTTFSSWLDLLTVSSARNRTKSKNKAAPVEDATGVTDSNLPWTVLICSSCWNGTSAANAQTFFWRWRMIRFSVESGVARSSMTSSTLWQLLVLTNEPLPEIAASLLDPGGSFFYNGVLRFLLCQKFFLLCLVIILHRTHGASPIVLYLR